MSNQRSLSSYDLTSFRKNSKRIRRQNTAIGLQTPIMTSIDLEAESVNLKIIRTYRKTFEDDSHKICKVSSSGEISITSTRLTTRKKQIQLLKESMEALQEFLPKKRSPRLQRKIVRLTRKVRKTHPNLSLLLDEMEEYDSLCTLDFAIQTKNIPMIRRFPSDQWSSKNFKKFLLLESETIHPEIVFYSQQLLEAWLIPEVSTVCLRENSGITQLPQFWLKHIEGDEWIQKLFSDAVELFCQKSPCSSVDIISEKFDEDSQSEQNLQRIQGYTDISATQKKARIINQARNLFRNLLLHIRNWPVILVQLFKMFDNLLVAKKFEMYEGCRSVIWICIFRCYLPKHQLVAYPSGFLSVVKTCLSYCQILPSDCLGSYRKTLTYLQLN